MSINTSELKAEREVLAKDFEALQSRIKLNEWLVQVHVDEYYYYYCYIYNY